MSELLYKYRNIDNFRFFAEIIINNRLYASDYINLNDPMEGQYLSSYNKNYDAFYKKVSEEKGRLKICSLSRNNNNYLLWSHYANGHKGVVLGVKVNRNIYDVRSIAYQDNIIIDPGLSHNHSITARDILTKKLKAWNYEEEERVFVIGKSYVSVDVREVIAGSRMSNKDFSFLKNFISKVNPQIKVWKND